MRTRANGHNSDPVETLAALAASQVAVGGLTYQTDTFNLAALNAAGAVTTAVFTGADLPAKARVMAQEIVNEIEFTSAGLTNAYVVSGTNDPHNVLSLPGTIGAGNPTLVSPAGSLFAQELSMQDGTNVYPTQGGAAPILKITLTGGPTFAGLSAGQVAVRTYYAIIP